MIEQLKNILPLNVYTELVKIVANRNLNKLHIAHFVSQCDHESQGFNK